MTGTASTEADEFAEIYKLEVVEIPTNVPVARKDSDDEVYRSATEKYDAVATLIDEARTRGQPVLVGTTSIEKSELISALMKQRGIPHNVLNARYHEQEAVIVAQAGRPGAVTIATNMAGRGTDIQLGGNIEMLARQEAGGLGEGPEFEAAIARHKPEVEAGRATAKAAGGLFVIGTERHESRRIDNQLRGRSGRQGDPGASRFFLSLEDDLMRIFGSDRMGGMLQKLGLKEGEAIVHPWINKALEKAQKKVEARNFDTRKNLLKYDDVMNDQRKEVYAQRKTFMQAADVAETVAEMRRECIGDMVDKAIPENAYPEQWDLRRARGQGARPARPRPAGRRPGPRRKASTRPQVRERIEAAADQHYRRQDGQYRPRPDAHGREVAAAADLRRGLEGAPAGARPPAPGHRAARLWPARPAERVQVRGLRPVQRHAGRPAGAGDQRADADRAAAGRAAALARAGAGDGHAPPRPGHGRAGDGRRGRGRRLCAGADGHRPTRARRAEAVDPNDPATWSRTPRNAPCPCGVGQEVQALPRPGLNTVTPSVAPALVKPKGGAFKAAGKVPRCARADSET